MVSTLLQLDTNGPQNFTSKPDPEISTVTLSPVTIPTPENPHTDPITQGRRKVAIRQELSKERQPKARSYRINLLRKCRSKFRNRRQQAALKSIISLMRSKSYSAGGPPAAEAQPVALDRLDGLDLARLERVKGSLRTVGHTLRIYENRRRRMKCLAAAESRRRKLEGVCGRFKGMSLEKDTVSESP